MTNYPDFYGDQLRWFIGKVTDIQDPLQLGRARVKIDGIHNGIANSQLPWAQTVVPITEGGTSGFGNNLGIQPGARVFGFFMDGRNSQLPVIMGSMPKFEDTVDSPATNDSQVTNKSTNSLATGTNTLAKTPDTVTSEPDSPYAAVYPHNKVTQTTSGHVIEIDDTPDAERIHVFHKSGSFVEFHPNGDVVTQHKNGFKLTTGDEKIHITGKLEITVDDDITIKSTGGNILIETEDTSKKIDLNP